MKRALITGVSGFVGGHLAARLLASPEWEVHGFDLRAPAFAVEFAQGDILDRAAIRRALESARPDVVFHLSGLLKSDDAELLHRIHAQGTLTLCEMILESGLSPRLVVASSSAVYGPGSGKRRIGDFEPPRPVTPYAYSKLAQEAAALKFARRGLPVVIARLFNLLGPGLSPVMACSAFAKQIADAEAGRQPPLILTGDLSAKRDFVDARDAARALELLATRGRPGEAYNVCSGRAVALQDCLNTLMRLSRVKLEQRLDPARVQAQDVPIQVGSSRRLRRIAGWRAEISVERSLADMLDYWRSARPDERSS